MILVNLLISFGFGVSLIREIGEYFSLHRDCRFHSTEHRYLRDLPQGWITGALGHYTRQQEVDYLRSIGIERIVTVSNQKELQGCVRVGLDDGNVGRMAARYYIRKGISTLCCIESQPMPFAKERNRSFKQEAFSLSGEEVRSFASVSAFIENQRTLGPCGLFFVSDSEAVKGMREMEKAGLHIPGDVAVIGVDNDELYGPFAPVELSSVQPAYKRIAFEACDLLRDGSQWQNGRIPDPVLIPPSQIIERRSSEIHLVASPIVSKTMRYLEDHLSSITNLDDVAASLHTHRRTLERHFRAETGLSVHNWLVRERVAYATKLLQETDYTVEHVADLSGFNTRTRLYRAFHQLGCTLPRKLRGG